MTTRRTKAAAASTYDAETTYSVQLTRPVEIPGGALIPTHRQRIKGRLLATLPADAIGSATALPASPLAAG